MKKIEILEHTADVRLKIIADSAPALFEGGLAGMNDLLYPGFCRKAASFSIMRRLSVQSPDLSALLIDFLSEVLTFSLTERAMFCELDILRLEDTRLEAGLRGVAVDQFHEDIKAVTYHEAEIVRNAEDNLETVIIFDI